MVRKNKQLKGQKPGEFLASWLNKPDLNPKRLEELLTNAQVVYRWVAKYPSLHRLNVASRKRKLPPEFWKSYEMVNETLENFAFAAQINLHELPDELVSWRLVADDKRIIIPLREVQWLVELMRQGTILKIRRCKQCRSWFFARVLHQAFCNRACRIKNLTCSAKFKKKRREYMRNYYFLQQSKNVK